MKPSHAVLSELFAILATVAMVAAVVIRTFLSETIPYMVLAWMVYFMLNAIYYAVRALDD